MKPRLFYMCTLMSVINCHIVNLTTSTILFANQNTNFKAQKWDFKKNVFFPLFQENLILSSEILFIIIICKIPI